jgi:hypothetical protein
MARVETLTDAERLELKDQLLMADLALRTKQKTWETPRNIAIMLGAWAAIMAAIFGILGYKIGSTPPQTIIVHLDTPLSIPQGTPRP